VPCIKPSLERVVPLKKIRFPDFRFSLPLWKEENLVSSNGCGKQAENCMVFGIGVLTHIRSMYGIFTYLWLIFMVNVSMLVNIAYMGPMDYIDFTPHESYT